MNYIFYYEVIKNKLIIQHKFIEDFNLFLIIRNQYLLE